MVKSFSMQEQGLLNFVLMPSKLQLIFEQSSNLHFDEKYELLIVCNQMEHTMFLNIDCYIKETMVVSYSRLTCPSQFNVFTQMMEYRT